MRAKDGYFEKVRNNMSLKTNYPELMEALHRSGMDKHRCFGCGHEHNCNIHGCTINHAACEAIGNLVAENQALRVQLDELNDFESTQCYRLLQKIAELEQVAQTNCAQVNPVWKEQMMQKFLHET